jgi:triphosphatase
MSDPREIELKLDVPVDSLRRLTSSSLFKSAGLTTSRPSNLVSVYFDTDGHKLRRKGISLRVRQISGRVVQTVKQESGAGAPLFNRIEWERAVPGGGWSLTRSATQHWALC